MDEPTSKNSLIIELFFLLFWIICMSLLIFDIGNNVMIKMRSQETNGAEIAVTIKLSIFNAWGK